MLHQLFMSLLAIWGAAVGYGFISVSPKDPVRSEAFMQKYGRLLRIASPILALSSLLLILRAFLMGPHGPAIAPPPLEYTTTPSMFPQGVFFICLALFCGAVGFVTILNANKDPSAGDQKKLVRTLLKISSAILLKNPSVEERKRLGRAFVIVSSALFLAGLTMVSGLI